MNKQERMLLDLCMSDQLFCTMYDGLYYMHQNYHSPSPTDVWLKSLIAFHDIYNASRPDIMADVVLEDADDSVIATVFYMVTVQDMDRSQEPTDLKDALCSKLARCPHWDELYERIRNSEEMEERKGRFVNTTDFLSREVPVFEDSPINSAFVEEFVNMTIALNDVNFSRSVAYVLRRINDKHGGVFKKEIDRLEQFADGFNAKTNEQLEEIKEQQKSSQELLKKAADKKVEKKIVQTISNSQVFNGTISNSEFNGGGTDHEG